MPGKKNYIPPSDADFELFFKNSLDYTTLKCSTNSPEWTHIPKKSLDSLNEAYERWHSAYQKMSQPHIPQDTTEKNRIKKESATILRKFVNEFLRYSSAVTNYDRDYMGIPNKQAAVPVSVPRDAPEFYVKIKGNRILAVHFRPAMSKSKARPYGYSGAVVYWGVLDTPPVSPEEFPHSELATKTPFTIMFREEERGKKVYIAIRWQNKKGELGPISDIQVTIVP